MKPQVGGGGIAAGGAADMVSAVLRSAMVQETADDELRGRLQGVFIVAVAGADGVVGVWAAVALVAFAAGGAADMVSAVLRSAMVQETADDELRGRLQGVFIV
ncbi:hypothetical protein MTQ19_04180, partial [Corynebacterium bovis]